MTLPSSTETPVGTQRPSACVPIVRLRLHQLLGALLLCLLSSVAVSTAYADAASDAEALIAQGIELRRQSKDSEALELFKQAAQVHSTPRAVAQMGLAEQALGRWVDAEEHIKLALEHPNHPWISRNRDTLTRSLAAVGEHLGAVELSCDVAGASVVVNGVPAGQTPLSAPLRVVSGTVVIEISAEGFHPMTRSLQVNAGSLARESVTLVPMRAAVVAPVVTPTLDPTTVPAVVTCEGGQVAVDGHCCWPGQSWIGTRQRCAGAPQCPAGMIASGLECAPTAPTPITSEHLMIRTEVTPGEQPQPITPTPSTQADDNPNARDAEGGEISLHIGYGGFFRRDAGLFTTNDAHGPHAFNLGGVLQFAAGYRPIRWVSFGAQIMTSLQEGDADYWDEQGGEGRLIAVSTGAYVRGHLVGELSAGAFDLWLGTGFHPFSRVWIDTKELPNYQVNAVAMPFEVGATLFGSQSFGIELKFSMLQWFALDYCASSDGNNVCGASVQPQTSWDTSLGFTWVL